MADFFGFLTGLGGYGAIAFAAALLLASRILPIAWGAVAMTVAFGVLGATFVAQREITSSVRHELEVERDKYQAAVNAAKQAELDEQKRQRALEQQAQAAIEGVANDAQKRIDAARADARRAGAAADGLRRQLATYLTAARAGSANASAAAAGPPATGALDLLADLFQRADGRAGELAAFADASHAAGAACERAYDGAREALK